jgi:hypothetical protein
MSQEDIRRADKLANPEIEGPVYLPQCKVGPKTGSLQNLDRVKKGNRLGCGVERDREETTITTIGIAEAII